MGENEVKLEKGFDPSGTKPLSVLTNYSNAGKYCPLVRRKMRGAEHVGVSSLRLYSSRPFEHLLFVRHSVPIHLRSSGRARYMHKFQ